jgi:multiple sugar transport system permease protein
MEGLMAQTRKLTKPQKQFIFTSIILSVILLMLFVVYPTFKLFTMGFTDWNGYSLSSNFVKFQNYTRLFQDENLWLSLKNNGIYFITHLLFIPIELALAVMLTTKMKAGKFYQLIVFMPYIINGVAISYAFSYFFTPINGAFNEILTALGMSNSIMQWLSDPKIVNYTLSFVSLWRFAGFHIILFVSALSSINNDLLEAAIIDGANAWQKFWKIQIPEISLIIDFILFSNVQGSLKQFDIPFVMTAGGPGYASSTFTLYTITNAFTYNNFGLAGAMSVIMIAMVALVSLLQNKGVAWLRSADDRKLAKNMHRGVK